MRHRRRREAFLGLFLGLSVAGVANAQPEVPVGGWHIILKDEELARRPLEGWTRTHTPSGETRSRGFVSGLGEICVIDENGTTSFPMRPFGNGYTGSINFSAALLASKDSNSDVLIIGQRARGITPDFFATVLDRDLKQILGQASVTAPPGELAGMSVALGDIRGDATPEIIFGSAPGVPGRIYVTDINRNNPITFFAFEPTFTGGVRVATGDLNGDGIPEIIAAPGTGGRIRAFGIAHGTEPRQVGDGFPFGTTFSGGMFVSASDVNGDGIDEIFVGQGTGAPVVRVFNIATPAPTMVGNFFAFDPNFTGGVRVSTGFVKGSPSVAATSGTSITVYQYTSDGDWKRQFGLPENPFAPASADDMFMMLMKGPLRF